MEEIGAKILLMPLEWVPFLVKHYVPYPMHEHRSLADLDFL